MAISQEQFCINLLTQYLPPGGPVDSKSQLTDDARRPLFKAKITEGFRLEENSQILIELTGVDDQVGTNLFSEECFTFNCFEESGITTTIDTVSTICMTDDNGDFRFRDVADGQLSCYINSFGKPSYFIRGTKDRDGFIYLADFGYVNPISGGFNIIEANVPFFSRNNPGTLYANSRRNISGGIKAVQIKRVGPNSLDVIGLVYGELVEEFYFPHNVLISARDFTFEEQKIDLENLAINLLLLTSFKSIEQNQNQIIYRNRNYSSPEVETIIQNSGQILQAIINTDAGSIHQGSLPRTIASYLNDEDQYNSEANENYANTIFNCFEGDCFDNSCFESVINNNLIDRSICNRAIAWVVQFLVSYSLNYNADVQVAIDDIMRYLDTQRDPVTHLFYKGYDQVDEECVEMTQESGFEFLTEGGEEICLEGEEDPTATTYNTSIERDTTIYVSTNAAIFMAYLKAFELTQDFDYITKADDLLSAIEQYLLNSEGFYVHSTEDKSVSIEAATYQLLIMQILQDFKNIENITAFFKARLLALNIVITDTVQVGMDDVLVGTDPVIVPDLTVFNSAADQNLFTLTTSDTYTSLDDIYKYNYLAYSSFINIDNSYAIDFLSQIRTKYAIIEAAVEENRFNSALTFSIGCIIDNASFLTFDNLQFNSMIDFHNYRFQKDALFNDLILTIPTDYSWYNPELLTKRSTIGIMLNSFAKTLARIESEQFFWERVGSLENQYGFILNNKAQDFGLVRFLKESDRDFRVRIRSELIRQSSSADAFISQMEIYNSSVFVNDNYKAATATETFDDNLYVSKWGEGYLPGPNQVNTNIFTLVFNQPLEPDVRNQVNKIKPAGMQVNIVETLSFSVGVELGEGTGIRFTDIAGGCDNLELETGDDLLQEDGASRLCLEDDETIILPVVLDPPVLPPLDNPIVTEDPFPCDCESLRGYLTLSTVATEVRNMRTVTTNYDVNITNDTGPTCNLFIGSNLDNLIQDFIELEDRPYPAEMTSAPHTHIRRVDYTIDSPLTDQTFTLWVSEDVGVQNFFVISAEGTGGYSETVILPFSLTQPYQVAQTNNYLFLTQGTDVYAVNKATLVVTTVVTGFVPAISEVRPLAYTNDKIRVYSRESTDDSVHHFEWDEATPAAITTLNVVNLGGAFTTRYVNNTTGVQRIQTNISDADTYDTPNFDELGTLISNYSISNSFEYQFSAGGSNYLGHLVEAGVFDTVNMYKGSPTGFLRFNHTDTVLSDLSYLAGPAFNYANRGTPYYIGGYTFLTGSNKAYNASSQTLDFINGLVCPSDTTTITAGYTVIGIGYMPSEGEALMLNSVDLTTGTWQRRLVKTVTKVC